jgi:hypothetical protein
VLKLWGFEGPYLFRVDETTHIKNRKRTGAFVVTLLDSGNLFDISCFFPDFDLDLILWAHPLDYIHEFDRYSKLQYYLE